MFFQYICNPGSANAFTLFDEFYLLQHIFPRLISSGCRPSSALWSMLGAGSHGPLLAPEISTLVKILYSLRSQVLNIFTRVCGVI